MVNTQSSFGRGGNVRSSTPRPSPRPVSKTQTTYTDIDIDIIPRPRARYVTKCFSPTLACADTNNTKVNYQQMLDNALGVCVAWPAWQSKGHHAPPCWPSAPRAQALPSGEEKIVCGGVVGGFGGHAVELLELRLVWPIGCDDGSCCARFVQFCAEGV
jgi:hypothetical protein